MGRSLRIASLSLGCACSAIVVLSCGLSLTGTGGAESGSGADANADLDSAQGPTSADGASPGSSDGGNNFSDGGSDGASTEASVDGTAPNPPDSGIGCTIGATATSLCDNFDNPITGWASFWTPLIPGGAAVLPDLTMSVSAPKSVYASAPQNTVDGYESGLYKQLAFGKTVTVDLDYNASVPSGGYVEIAQIMRGGMDDGRFLVSSSDTISYIDGYSGTPRLGVSTTTDTTGSWHHVEVVFTFAATGGGTTIQVDHGAILPSDLGNTLGTQPATLDIHVGNSPGTSQGGSHVNVDNFVLTVGP